VIRRVLFLALGILVVGSLAGPAVGNSLDEDLKEIRQSILAITARIDDGAAERSILAQDALLAQGKLDAAEIGVAVVKAKLTRVSIEHDERSVILEGVRAELAERLSALSIIRADRDAAFGDAKASVLQAYMSGGAAQPSIAFSATVVSEFSVGVAYVEVLTGHRTDAADRYADIVVRQEAEEAEIKAVEASVSREVEALEGTAAEIDATRLDLELKRSDLVAEYEDQLELLAQIEIEIAEFDGELTALEREEASIRSKIRAASQPTGTKPGQLLRPIPGRIESTFGPRVHPIYGNVRMHNGLDMDGSTGDPIRASAGGTVILVGVKGGYGNTVMIDHGGGMVTLYAHQSKIGVSVGQKVTAGQTIGYVGSTGVSTGPHLHFEVRIDGAPVDPMKYL